jgi:N-methylhydantoinase B
MNAAELEIFRHLFASIAEEMGVTLGRSGYSPNIKERRDYSCAVFLADGRMLAQAAHIPVHLGAMPASVRAAINAGEPFSPGDVVILNDPYLGGTHLPDITLVSPVFVADELAFFAASRAHHSDIGGMAPGSMPVSTEIYQEGFIIPPVKLVEGGSLNTSLRQMIVRNSRTPEERLGDLAAQQAAHATGERRIQQLVERYGLGTLKEQAEGLLTYAERLTRAEIASIPDGTYTFDDVLDGDGISGEAVTIQVAVRVAGDSMHVDFEGTSGPVRGSVNAVPAIAHSAVLYVLRCLGGQSLPMNAGVLAPVEVHIPQNSLLDAGPPHAVAAGNVETSQRIVDCLYGALAQALPGRIPAASQGTMNNLSFGGNVEGQPFAYYETIGGGAGANADADGASGIQTHMTNTLNTPVEAIEMTLPIRVQAYGLRHGSGGGGQQHGGDGVVKVIEFLAAARVTLLTERREHAPYGLQGGEPGQTGQNVLIRATGERETLSGKATFDAAPGDLLRIETPGGGGWGEA